MVETSYDKGIQAEERAVAYLIRKGHTILSQRFKTPYGEIDIISDDGQCFVFTEVKQRATHTEAAYALNGTQKKRLQNAGLVYTQKIHETKPCRFDVVLLNSDLALVHMENIIWDE